MPEGHRPVWVTVWAVINLGWLRVVGPPLHLGPATRTNGRTRDTRQGRLPWYLALLQKVLNS